MSSSLQIIFFNQTLGIGGAETFNRDLLGWFTSQNHKVTAYTTNPVFGSMLNQVGVHAHKCPFVVDIIGDWKGFIKGVFLFFPAWAWYISKLAKHRNTDVVFMTGYIEKIFISPVARLLKIPVVWLEFAPTSEIFSRFFDIPNLLYTLVARLPLTIIVPSQNTLVHQKDFYSLPESHFTLIPLGRKSDIISSSTKTVSNLVTCVSRLEPGKGQDLLIKSWEEVIKVVPLAKLIIVGGGDFRPSLERLVSKLGLSTSITFTGSIQNSHALKILSSGQVCAFPTVWQLEGFGIVAIEAMALAKPVVCFNTGPLPEIVDKDTGIVVKSGDVKGFSQALVNLLTHPKLRQKLGEGGQKKFRKFYTIESIAPKYYEIFTTAH